MSQLSEWVEKHRDNPDDEMNVRDYTLNKDYYERKFAEAKPEEIVICSACEYPHVIGSSSADPDLVKHQCCFHCWFWLHHIGLKNGPTARSIIVNGTHYVDAGNKPREKSQFLGYGGSKWLYRKIGESDYVETNNMWHQGKIPKRFDIPDTHEFKPYERKEVTNGGTHSPFEG